MKVPLSWLRELVHIDVPLTELRANRALRKVKFLKNVRLIISPLSDEEYEEIMRMAGIVASPGMPLP